MSKKNEETANGTERIVEVSTAVKAEPVKKAKFSAYIGPNILGVIQNGTVYDRDAEAVKTLIAPAIEKHPAIAYFVVNDYELAAKRKEVKTDGSFLNKTYKKLTKK